MEQDRNPDDAQPTAVPTHKVEAVVALITLALGVVVMVESRKLGAGWTSDGPGSGYFPFYVGLVVAIASLGLLVQALRAAARHTRPFVDTPQLKRVMSVLLPAIAYSLAVRFLGLYVASAIYIALFMVILGRYAWPKAVAAALAIVVLVYLMFELWFKVPLYPGALDPLGLLLHR